MNADTGRVHDLEGVLKAETVFFPGQPLESDMLAEVDDLEGEAKARLEALKGELDAGEPVVGVSGDVVQRLRLGDRELDRRARRRQTPPPGPPNPPTPLHHRPVG